MKPKQFSRLSGRDQRFKVKKRDEKKSKKFESFLEVGPTNIDKFFGFFAKIRL